MLLIIGSAVVTFCVVGLLFYTVTGKRLQGEVAKAEKRAESLLMKASQERERLLTEARREANELTVEGKERTQEEIRTAEEELHESELRLEKEQQRLDTMQGRLQAKEKTINARYAEVKSRQVEAKGIHKQRRELIMSEVATLEEVLGVTRDEVIESIGKRFIDLATHEAKQTLRQTSEIAESEYAPLAKRVMGITLGRIGQTKVKERPIVSVVGTRAAYENLIAAVGGEEAGLEALFGIPLVTSEEGDQLTIRFDTLDTVRREVVRRVLEKSFAVGKIPNNLQELFDRRVDEMDNELVGLGRRAFKMVGLKPKADKEIIKLLGRLYYRTSYTQNQWLHSVEAAQIAGLMAHELKLDVTLAKRASLLHDIGKALTHEIEGSHAVIGADIAEKHGEDPLVVNAIGSHHGDRPEESLYARIVMASDALSGARPGARRELVETYFDRIRQIEGVARGFRGVREVHAVQAGRELRVIVDNNMVTDQDTQQIADGIATKISDEVVFPGKIKVTVIRRYNIVEYAR